MKNNKKGFTLVELLAVIVILAVVILIAVTAVIPRMNKAKWKSFGDEALAFIKAADEKSVADDLGEGRCYVINTQLKGDYVEKADGSNYTGIVCRTATTDPWKIYIKQSAGNKYAINGKTATQINNSLGNASTGSISKTSCPTDYTSWTC